MKELKKRKTTRLTAANYNAPGVYFLTICTMHRRCVLSRIVGQPICPAADFPVGTGVLDGPPATGVLDGPATVGFNNPETELTPYGKIAEKYIKQLSDFYSHISVKHYVIMPNHIHLLLVVKSAGASVTPVTDGPSRTPVPTGVSVVVGQNSVVAKFVSTFKRFCNREYGVNIWQYRSYDHIIRDRSDYEEHVKYIQENPKRWYVDELFSVE